jgi:hypothetical protein
VDTSFKTSGTELDTQGSKKSAYGRQHSDRAPASVGPVSAHRGHLAPKRARFNTNPNMGVQKSLGSACFREFSTVHHASCSKSFLMRFLPIACFALITFAGPALAIEEKVSGLAVNLPDTFIVEKALPPAYFAISFGVKFASGTPAPYDGEAHLCSVNFAPIPEYATLNKSQINAVVESGEWLDDWDFEGG